MDERTRLLVRQRAGNQCKYCELTEAQSPVAKLQIRVLEVNSEDRIRLRLTGV